MNVEEQIMKKVKSMPSLWCFCSKDMLEIGNYKAVAKALERLTDKGLIKRIGWGIYSLASTIYPKKELLDSAALAIARNNDWTIIPSGKTALNLLGIIHEEDNTYIYISNGPYRKYSIDNEIILFKRTALSFFNGSKKNIIIFQALKEIGDKAINEEIIGVIEHMLSSEEKKKLAKDIIYTPVWMHKHINRICLTK